MLDLRKMEKFRHTPPPRNPTIGLGLKIFSRCVYLIPLFFVVLTMIPLISADWDWDNVKSYDETTKTISFKDSILGIPTTDIATAKLNTPQINYVIQGKNRLVAEFEIDLFDNSYTDALKDMEFINLKNGQTFQRDFKYKYKIIKIIEVDDIQEVCKEVEQKDIKNSSKAYECNQEKIGTKLKEDITWTDAPDKTLLKGKTTIGIFTDVYAGDYVEWIPTLFGLKATEWATWTDSLSVNLQAYWTFNETTGVVFNDSRQTPPLNLTLTDSHNITGKIGYGYKTDGKGWNETNFKSSGQGTVNWWMSEIAGSGLPWSNFDTTLAGADGDISYNCDGLTHQCRVVAYDPALRISTYRGVFPAYTMITVTWNSTTIAVYFNSTLDEQISVTTFGVGAGNNFRIFAGRDNPPAEIANNYNIDELGFWNRTLTPSEITDLYNEGNGITYNPNSSSPTLPTITITYPIAKAYNYVVTQLNYTIAVGTYQGCYYSTDEGATNVTMVCGENITGLTSVEGSNIWKVYINDSAGNVNSGTVTFTQDTIIPSVSIVYPSNTSYNYNVSQLNYTYTDTNTGNCWFTKDSGLTNSSTVTSGINFTNTKFSEGSNTVILYCNDSAGNVNGSSTVTFFKDSIFPSIDFIPPTPSNGANISINNLSIKVNITETNSINVTFRLYNSTRSLINESFGQYSYDLCYQETANVSTSCGGLDSGNYNYEDINVDNKNGYDGDWSTYFQQPGSTTNYYYVNYTKPKGAIGAIWEIKYGHSVYEYWINISLNNNSQCFTDFDNIALRQYLSEDGGRGGQQNAFFCLSIGGWQNLYTQPGINAIGLFEEAIYWNITNNNSQTYNNLADGIYYYNVTATDSINHQNTTETRKVTIDTTAPILNITYPSSGINPLLEYLTNSSIFNRNMTWTTIETNPNNCWWKINYYETNLSGFNVSVKGMDITSTNKIYYLKPDEDVYYPITYTPISGVGFTNFSIPADGINANNEFILRFRIGDTAGMARLYEINLTSNMNPSQYELYLNGFSCLNQTGVLTDCSNAFDRDYDTYAYDSAAATYSYIIANYSILKRVETNCQDNTSMLNLTTYKTYDLFFYMNDTSGNTDYYNISFIFKPAIQENSYTYNSSTYESSKESFNINLNFPDDIYNFITGTFIYNGTSYIPTQTNLGGGSRYFSISKYIPLQPSKQNITFYWTFGLTNSLGTSYLNSTVYNQTVDLINMSVCTSGNIALNVTNYDEDSKARIITFLFNGGFKYSLGGGNVFRNFTVANPDATEVAFCIDTNRTYYLTGQIDYSNLSLGYSQRTYYMNNYPINNITTNLFIYSLLTTKSTSFIIHVQDTAYISLEDYQVRINKWFPELNSYSTIQTVTTDENGDAPAVLETETVDYQFVVYDPDGNLVHTSKRAKVIPKEAPYTIYITVGDIIPSPISYLEPPSGLTYTLSYNQDTKLITYEYSDTNSSFSSARLYVFRSNPTLGNIDVCNLTLSSISGVLICNVTGNSTGTYVAQAYIKRGIEQFVDNVTFEIKTFTETAGMLGIFGAFLIILICAFAFAYNEVAGIILVNLGIIFVNLIGLVHFGIVYITAIIGVSIIMLVILKRG